jgi:hypothetical protein
VFSPGVLQGFLTIERYFVPRTTERARSFSMRMLRLSSPRRIFTIAILHCRSADHEQDIRRTGAQEISAQRHRQA